MENYRTRCSWCLAHPDYLSYHDQEWGVPVHDDRKLFEFLVLEGAQAGLSWLTILKRRENYRQAFHNFAPEKVACFDQAKIAALLQNSGIIRNRRKIESAVTNAQAFLEVSSEFGSFDAYVWRFVDGQPICNTWKKLEEIPAVTTEAEVMSRDMKKRGFTFFGPTICYAHMQATGMVNDHVVNCFRHEEIMTGYGKRW